MIRVFICMCLFPPVDGVMNKSKSDGRCSRSFRVLAKLVLVTNCSPFHKAVASLNRQSTPHSFQPPLRAFFLFRDF
jgi:hypothetical protein